MNYTQSIGNVVELQCISKFIEMGFQCSIPYGNSAKYDFIAELPNGELIKIQCKSSVWDRRSSQEKASFHFPCTCSTTNTKETIKHTYSKEEIDYFATYFEGQVYIVPVEECSTSKTLRLLPPKNGNTNYSMAENYTIEKMFGFLQDEKFSTELEKHINQINDFENFVPSGGRYTCSECGKPIWNKGGLCVECYRLKSRTVDRPSREELKQLIRTTPFTTIGRQFGVTDNTIRKWCDAENLPRRVGDIKAYSDEDWAKI